MPAMRLADQMAATRKKRAPGGGVAGLMGFRGAAVRRPGTPLSADVMPEAAGPGPEMQAPAKAAVMPVASQAQQPEVTAAAAQAPAAAPPTPATEAPIRAPGGGAGMGGGVNRFGQPGQGGAGILAPPAPGLRRRLADQFANQAEAPGQGMGPMAGRFAPATGEFMANWMRGRKKMPGRLNVSPAQTGGFR